jgi:hypothetical protein
LNINIFWPAPLGRVLPDTILQDFACFASQVVIPLTPASPFSRVALCHERPPNLME